MKQKEYSRNISVIYLCIGLILSISVPLLTFILQILGIFKINVGAELRIIFNLVCYYLVGLPIFMLLTKNINYKAAPLENPEGMTLGKLFKVAAVCYACALVCNFVSQYLVVLVNTARGMDLSKNNINLGAVGNLSLFWSFILVGIAVPILEENLFRRILYNKLSAYGDKVYILVSAITFSLFHMELEKFLYAFVCGLVLAYVYSKTQKLYCVAAIHIIINMMSVITMAVTMVYKNKILINIYIVALFAFIIYGFISIYSVVKGVRLSPAEVDIDKPVLKSIVNPGLIAFAIGVLSYAVVRFLYAYPIVK